MAIQSTGTNGELTINVGVLTDSIWFRAPGKPGDGSDQEFAVQKLVMGVPEPSTMFLLGIGLVGLVGASVKRRLSRVSKGL